MCLRRVGIGHHIASCPIKAEMDEANSDLSKLIDLRVDERQDGAVDRGLRLGWSREQQ